MIQINKGLERPHRQAKIPLSGRPAPLETREIGGQERLRARLRPSPTGSIDSSMR